jgi:hypothetical protein
MNHFENVFNGTIHRLHARYGMNRQAIAMQAEKEGDKRSEGLFEKPETSLFPSLASVENLNCIHFPLQLFNDSTP